MAVKAPERSTAAWQVTVQWAARSLRGPAGAQDPLLLLRLKEALMFPEWLALREEGVGIALGMHCKRPLLRGEGVSGMNSESLRAREGTRPLPLELMLETPGYEVLGTRG